MHLLHVCDDLICQFEYISRFSDVPGHDGGPLLHPGGQPVVQVLLEVLHEGDGRHQEGQQRQLCHNIRIPKKH